MLYCTKHSGSHGLVYLPHWHTAVYMEKTEGCHAFPELSASRCDNSVFLETEACKKGAKETQNSNFLGLHCILYKRMKPALVIWNFVLILFKYSCISFFFFFLCVLLRFSCSLQLLESSLSPVIIVYWENSYMMVYVIGCK
jgi:hypothetical protein